MARRPRTAISPSYNARVLFQLTSAPPFQPCDRAWLLDNVKGASGILCMLNDKCDEELIKAAGKDLKVVSSFSAGGRLHMCLESML